MSIDKNYIDIERSILVIAAIETAIPPLSKRLGVIKATHSYFLIRNTTQGSGAVSEEEARKAFRMASILS